MKKVTLITSCALLAASVISCSNNKVGIELDSISYGKTTTFHTKYTYDSDGKTYEIKGEEEKRECQILPSGEILRYSEYYGPVKVPWILSELADFSQAIKRLKNETDVRYSINSTKKTIILKYPDKIYTDSDAMHVYKLSYKGTDSSFGVSSPYYLSKIVYDVENGESAEYTFDISSDHKILSIDEANGYENPETIYIYKNGNNKNNLFCSIKTEDDFESEGGSNALTLYYYDENNRLKKTITNTEIIFTDFEENGEKESTRYEETITEYKYKDGKLIESITKSRESIQ